MISFLFLMLCFFQSIITNVINIIVICVVTQSYKQVVLTPQSTGNDARVVILSSTEVTSSSSAWTISPIDTKFGWHLKVNLDASWGFDPNYESTITFQIDGDPLPTDRSLFAFTTGRINQNGKYIMARIRRFHWNYMFPQCSATTMIFGDANAVLDSCPDNDPSFEDRVDCLQSRLGMHHLSDEINTIQGNGDKAFPIKFTLTNKPDESLRLTIESTSTNQDYIDVCDYESFDNTNDGLRVYFAVDYSTTTTVNSFTITYSTTAPITTTPNPTLSPSKRPTSNPTRRPTPNPTLSPSKRPTSNPTRRPTPNPTLSPSKRPTSNPTRKMPSTDPMEMPIASTDPTIDPFTTADTVIDISTTSSAVFNRNPGHDIQPPSMLVIVFVKCQARIQWKCQLQALILQLIHSLQLIQLLIYPPQVLQYSIGILATIYNLHQC
eukprot:927950_1